MKALLIIAQVCLMYCSHVFCEEGAIEYNIGEDASASGMFSENAVDDAGLFDGTVKQSYPVWTLGEKGGAGYSVALTYSSNIYNTIFYSNKLRQTSWIGTGWSCSPGYIISDMHHTVTIDDDTYTCVSDNGGSSELIRGTGNTFHLRTKKYKKIERVLDPNDLETVTGWIVTDGNGIRYKYGSYGGSNACATILATTVDGISYIGAFGNETKANAAEPMNFKWYLSEIEDLFGNKVLFDYEAETGTVAANTASYTTAVYISTIKYVPSGQNATASVEFVRQDRDGSAYEPKYTATDYACEFYETEMLSNVVCRSEPLGNPVKEIALSHDEKSIVEDTPKDFLVRIDEYDKRRKVTSTAYSYYEASATEEYAFKGALKSVTLPNGKANEYRYGKLVSLPRDGVDDPTDPGKYNALAAAKEASRKLFVDSMTVKTHTGTGTKIGLWDESTRTWDETEIMTTEYDRFIPMENYFIGIQENGIDPTNMTIGADGYFDYMDELVIDVNWREFDSGVDGWRNRNSKRFTFTANIPGNERVYRYLSPQFYTIHPADNFFILVYREVVEYDPDEFMYEWDEMCDMWNYDLTYNDLVWLIYYDEDETEEANKWKQKEIQRQIHLATADGYSSNCQYSSNYWGGAHWQLIEPLTKCVVNNSRVALTHAANPEPWAWYGKVDPGNVVYLPNPCDLCGGFDTGMGWYMPACESFCYLIKPHAVLGDIYTGLIPCGDFYTETIPLDNIYEGQEGDLISYPNNLVDFWPDGNTDYDVIVHKDIYTVDLSTCGKITRTYTNDRYLGESDVYMTSQLIGTNDKIIEILRDTYENTTITETDVFQDEMGGHSHDQSNVYTECKGICEIPWDSNWARSNFKTALSDHLGPLKVNLGYVSFYYGGDYLMFKVPIGNDDDDPDYELYSYDFDTEIINKTTVANEFWSKYTSIVPVGSHLLAVEPADADYPNSMLKVQNLFVWDNVEKCPELMHTYETPLEGDMYLFKNYFLANSSRNAIVFENGTMTYEPWKYCTQDYIEDIYFRPVTEIITTDATAESKVELTYMNKQDHYKSNAVSYANVKVIKEDGGIVDYWYHQAPFVDYRNNWLNGKPLETRYYNTQCDLIGSKKYLWNLYHDTAWPDSVIHPRLFKTVTIRDGVESIMLTGYSNYNGMKKTVRMQTSDETCDKLIVLEYGVESGDSRYAASHQLGAVTDEKVYESRLEGGEYVDYLASHQKTLWGEFAGGMYPYERQFKDDDDIFVTQGTVDILSPSGRPVQVGDAMGVRTSTVLGYTDSLSVAQVVNARLHEVAYTGFEDMAVEPARANGWDIIASSGHICQDEAYTGAASFRITNGPMLSKYFAVGGSNGLQVDRDYRITLRARKEAGTAGVTVSFLNSTDLEQFSTTPITLVAAGEGWYEYSCIIKGTSAELGHPDVAAIAVMVKGNGTDTDWLLDDIRFYPDDARMTTMTYDEDYKKPTSVMDDNGIVERYVLDGSGTVVRTLNNDNAVVNALSYRRVK